jgi:hypothetical protein
MEKPTFNTTTSSGNASYMAKRAVTGIIDAKKMGDGEE